jgi:hypothetical protein
MSGPCCDRPDGLHSTECDQWVLRSDGEGGDYYSRRPEVPLTRRDVLTAPTPSDVITRADLERAYERMRQVPVPPEIYVVHPDDLEHLRSHGEEADMSCVRCLQIWVGAQRVRYSW